MLKAKRNEHLKIFGLWYFVFMVSMYAMYTITKIRPVDSFHNDLIHIGNKVLLVFSIITITVAILNGIISAYYAVLEYKVN